MRGVLRDAKVVVLPEGGHSPHSERVTTEDVTRAAQTFVAGLVPAAGAAIP